jgi:hypothetical protein
MTKDCEDIKTDIITPITPHVPMVKKGREQILQLTWSLLYSTAKNANTAVVKIQFSRMMASKSN